MHSLFHLIAGRRLEMRYGLVMDNPGHAVSMRDAWVDEHYPSGKLRGTRTKGSGV